MKVIVEIPDKKVKLELNNTSINIYRMIGSKINQFDINEKYPIGEPIFILTNNIPTPLMDIINRQIEQFCNIEN